jgi:hypothetical protein
MGRALGTASGNVASVSSGDFEGVLYRARVRWRESRKELALAANAALNFRYTHDCGCARRREMPLAESRPIGKRNSLTPKGVSYRRISAGMCQPWFVT